jgi:mannonate dehydratase
LEPYHLFWLEDPVAAELQEGFRTVRQPTTTALAVGEVFNSVGCTPSDWPTIDWLHPNDGSSRRRNHASEEDRCLADIYHVRRGCHGATDLSPVAMAAALHYGTIFNW